MTVDPEATTSVTIKFTQDGLLSALSASGSTDRFNQLRVRGDILDVGATVEGGENSTRTISGPPTEMSEIFPGLV